MTQAETLAELLQIDTKAITITKRPICGRCDGTGRHPYGGCWSCGGTGLRSPRTPNMTKQIDDGRILIGSTTARTWLFIITPTQSIKVKFGKRLNILQANSIHRRLQNGARS